MVVWGMGMLLNYRKTRMGANVVLDLVTAPFFYEDEDFRRIVWAHIFGRLSSVFIFWKLYFRSGLFMVHSVTQHCLSIAKSFEACKCC